MTFTHGVARFITDKTAAGVIRNLQKDKTRELLKLLDTAERVAGKMFQPKTYAAGREVINNPDNKWHKYLYRFLDETHPNVIKTAFMTVAFESAWYGTKQIRKNREKYHCNIPWIMLIDPTSACNLHCTGCWAAEYGHKLNLSYDELDSIITQGKALGTYFYMFTGGEPLVRKADILKLAKKHHECGFNIFTNGTLIDDAFCAEVQKLGNILFSVSIEGFKEVNDSRRGIGVYDSVMAAFQRMKRYGLLYGTSICYTSKNCEAVTSDEFLDLLIENGCRYNWYFNYMPVGKNANVDLIPTVEQRKYMIKRIREIRSAKSDKQIFVMDFQNDGEFVGGCIAGGRNYCHINANGDVEPCVFIHYSSANIRDMPLIDCLRQPLFMAYHDGQPFNRNHLRPCPMLENPDLLVDMVRRTGAKSTNLEAPESAETLCAKCKEYARDWAPEAKRIWDAEPKHHVQYYENYKGVDHRLGQNEDFKRAAAAETNGNAVIHRRPSVQSDELKKAAVGGEN